MTETDKRKYILPAEWYEQSGVQLTWPHEDTDWRPYLDEITEVCLNLVRVIAGHEKVLVAARDAEKVRQLIESATDEVCTATSECISVRTMTHGRATMLS